MKEAIWAIVDELKRLRAEGEEGIPLSEEAFEELTKFARIADGQEVIDTPDEVEFVKKVDFDFKKQEETKQHQMAQKLKIVVGGRDFLSSF